MKGPSDKGQLWKFLERSSTSDVEINYILVVIFRFLFYLVFIHVIIFISAATKFEIDVDAVEMFTDVGRSDWLMCPMRS